MGRLTHGAVVPLILSVLVAGVLQILWPIHISWEGMWAGAMMTIWSLGWYSCWLLRNTPRARSQYYWHLRITID